LGHSGNRIPDTKENEDGTSMTSVLADNSLISSYRSQEGDSEDLNGTVVIYEIDGDETRPTKRSRYTDLLTSIDIKPLGRSAVSSTAKSELTTPKEHTKATPTVRQPSRKEIAAIIAAASAAAAAVALPPQPRPPEENGTSRKKSTSKPTKKPQTKEEKEANKEKRLQKLVGSVVVKYMSKYQKQMDHTQFKKHAKEVCLVCLEIYCFPH
jgi:[histone H3]-lysine36 N-trimethyltransferase